MLSHDYSLMQQASELDQQGRAGDAMSLLEKRLSSANAPRELCLLLAKIAARHNSPQREARALAHTLSTASQPREAPLLGRLGTLLLNLGDTLGAARAFSRATQLQPQEFAAWQGLAKAALARQDVATAEQVSVRLMAQFPEQVFSHLLAGHLAKARGDAGAAQHHYQRALKLETHCGEALYGLVDLDTPAADSPLAIRAKQLAHHAAAVANRINGAFAYARTLDHAGQYADAMHYFQRANNLALEDLALRGVRHDPGRLSARIESIRRLYPTSLATAASTESAPCPLFIVGLPRSGTTLVEGILGGHPQVQAGGELPFLQECERHFMHCRHQAGLNGPINPASETDARLLYAARLRYREALGSRAQATTGWIVDKLPANFQSLGFLRLLFPQAPVVHVVRDLRATAFSLYCSNFAGHEPYYHSLQGLLDYCSYYREVMHHWKSRIPGMVEVSYEKLVTSPEEVIPALLKAVGPGTTYPGCSAPHRNVGTVLTASHAQVRQPIHTGAIDHWRHYEPWLGPLSSLAKPPLSRD